MEVTVSTDFVYKYFKKHEGRKLVVDGRGIKLESVNISCDCVYLVFSYKNWYKCLFIDGTDEHTNDDISPLLKRELHKWALDVDYKQYFDLEWE